MKRLLKSLILILVLSLSLGVVTFAEGTSGSGTGGSGSGTGSQTVINGASWQKSGFVYYIVDKNGNIVAEPQARVSFDKYPDASHVYQLYTRFGNKKVSKLNGSMQDLNIWWQKPPFNESSSGNGSYIKNWLLTKTDDRYNVLRFITQVWDEATAKSFSDNDQYLIIEPFIWCGVYKDNKHMANIVGTTLGFVQAREKLGCSTNGLETRYSLGNLPNSMAFDIPVLGVAAPSSLNGKHSFEELKSLGYGVIAVWSSEVKPDPNPPTPNHTEENADAIKSNELNFIYKNFSGSRTGSKDGFEIQKIDMNDFREHTSDTDDYIDDFTVSESKTGDLWSFKGNNVLFYRPANGLWKIAKDTKNFNKDNQVYPQYTYNISRALWKDDLILCNFKKAKINGGLSEETIREYAKSQLGIESGNTGKVTQVSSGINVDSTYGVSKSDSYSFKGSTKEHWKTYDKVGSHIENEGLPNEITVDDYDWVNHEADIESGEISYSVTHFVDKYKAPDTGVVTNSKIQTIAFKTYVAGTRACNRAALILQGNSQLKVYPEVKMTMYYTGNTSTYLDGVLPLQVYIMGEQARKCQPAVICFWQSGFTSGMNLTGKTGVDNALTGTKAFEWAKTWQKDGNFQDYFPVCAQGGSFQTRTINNPVVKLTTISLDVLDNVNGQSIKSAWGNSYNSKNVHESFVSAIENNLETKVEMKRFTNNNMQFGGTDEMSYDISDTKINYLGTDKIALNYEDGMIKNRAEVISFISKKCGVGASEAETILANSGIEQELDEMFVTNKDADNNSKDKWYSEDSITLCLVSHQSNLVLGNILFSDKQDYGSSLSQDANDITKNNTLGVQVRFYFSLFLNSDVLSVEGYDFDVSSMRYLIDQTEIKGARFLLSNVTTHDWLN